MEFNPGRRQLLTKAALVGGSLLHRPNEAAAKLPEIPPGINFDVPPEVATYENFVRIRQQVEAAGLKVWNIGNSGARNMEEVTLNLPGRDQKIEEYKQYLRNLAKAGLTDARREAEHQ